MHRFFLKLLPATLFVISVPTLRADVTMPAIFGDHMVLQQDIKLPVWGHADPGEKVTVAIEGKEAQTTADAQGLWSVKLDPMPVTGKPVEVTVRGNNQLVFKDVLVGDVWVCSGQSNMEFGIGMAENREEALQHADVPQMRLFIVKRTIAFAPATDLVGHWAVCTAETLQNGWESSWSGFSAVGYFFGRDLYDHYKKPIGLIQSSWGGTPAESWTSLEKLQSLPALAHYAQSFLAKKENLPKSMEAFSVKDAQWQKDDAEWKAKPEPKGPAPRKPTQPDTDAHIPTVLYNGMIHPLLRFGIKGTIWYQGESNADAEERASEYATLFPAMITDWRERWDEGQFPFLFVQLASFGPGKSWGTLRDSQLKALSLPNTGMAVAIDVGNEKDIHPKDKLDVGHRLALAARHIAYGEDIVYSGPIFKAMKVEGNKAIVSFDHNGSGLVVGNPEAKGKEAGADHLNAFEIAGADGKFVPAEAAIKGETVVVESPEVPAPVAVRYAWDGFPTPPTNLYNKEGLPASPFNSQTDSK